VVLGEQCSRDANGMSGEMSPEILGAAFSVSETNAARFGFTTPIPSVCGTVGKLERFSLRE